MAVREVEAVVQACDIHVISFGLWLMGAGTGEPTRPPRDAGRYRPAPMA